MHEITLNLHIHTSYSDGSLTHAEIARAAIRSGLDALLITDHNVFVGDKQGYYEEDGKKVLLMVGEEVHNPDRQPQKSHLLVFGAGKDLAEFGYDPQVLINKVRASGGICFLAHPYDPALPEFGEDNISWADWDVSGFNGIELWNGFSEFKLHIRNKVQALFYAFYPNFYPHQPPEQTLKIWNKLLAKGHQVVAIGGSDAHAARHSLGPLSRIIFPYEFHFRAVNTHLLLPGPLTGNVDQDSQSIIMAMRNGNGFVGYDLPARTHGFRFWAVTPSSDRQMGEEFLIKADTHLNIHLPSPAECQLLKDGQLIQQWVGETDLQYSAKNPGVYRVECYRHYLGRRRGWIYSNPIYIR